MEFKMLKLLLALSEHSIRLCRCTGWSQSSLEKHVILSVLLCPGLGRVKRIWYLSPMRAVKVQASLHIRAVSPEPPLLAHTSSESRGTFRQKARSLAPLNGWACAVTICHDGMLEDTNSLDAARLFFGKICIKVIVLSMIYSRLRKAYCFCQFRQNEWSQTSKTYLV